MEVDNQNLAELYSNFNNMLILEDISLIGETISSNGGLFEKILSISKSGYTAIGVTGHNIPRLDGLSVTAVHLIESCTAIRIAGFVDSSEILTGGSVSVLWSKN